MGQSSCHIGFTTLASGTNDLNLPVRGGIPEWLTGSLIRTGPAQFEVGATSLNHWFDGMAMLHRFGIKSGHIFYSNRFLQSQSYLEANAKGAITRGEFATDPCRTLFQRVVAIFSPKFTDNACVNVAQWSDAFVALTETRLPVRFDPLTLETLGLREYSRDLKGPISTAHPHYDRQRRKHYSHIIDFGWRNRYRLFTIDADTGRESLLTTIPVDRPAYLHSFGMTERYLVLAEFPFVVYPLHLLMAGRPFIRNYQWQPDRGVRFHIIEKETGRVVRTAQTSPFFAFHHANAFEEGDDIVVDIIAHQDSTVIDQLYLNRLRSAEPIHAGGRLTRFRIRSNESITGDSLSNALIELPRFDYRRRAGRNYRYLYAVSQPPTGDFFNSLVKLDLDQNTNLTWHEPGCYPGEPVFVSRPGSDKDDDGVILSVVLETSHATSFLLILDASTLTELARASAPHHIPFSFHGEYFVDAK